MKTIGLDIGTTSISAVVLDTGLQTVLTSRTIPNGSFIKTENDWERIQDASVLADKAVRLLEELVSENPDVEAIGLTGQMHGIVYLDPEGQALSPLYTWEDGRGDLPVDGGPSSVRIIQDRCSLPVATGYGLVTHLYHTRTGQVPAGARTVCTIPDYIGMKLTGRTQPLLNSTMAASFGFFDLKQGSFNRDAIRKCGMDPSILPEVTGEVRPLGTYRGLPVMTALGDNQASFFGAAGMEKEAWLLNVGTGGQISVLSDTVFEAPGVEARPYLQGKFLLAGSTLCCGRAYAILENFFRTYAAALNGEAKEQYQVMEKLIHQQDVSLDRMQVITKFGGTRIDHTVRGSILNISENNFTPAGMIMGVLTGISQELYDWYNIIHKGTGLEIKRLLGSGNGVRKNRTLNRIFSEMFGSSLELSKYEEEAASGAAVACTFLEKQEGEGHSFAKTG